MKQPEEPGLWIMKGSIFARIIRLSRLINLTHGKQVRFTASKEKNNRRNIETSLLTSLEFYSRFTLLYL